MTGDQVYRIMEKAAELLRLEQPGDIDLDPSLPCGYGSTIEDPDLGVSFQIGVAGLKGNHKRLSNGVAMVPIGALFHEVCGHGGQLKYEFNKDDDLSTLLALNCYARHSAPAYYMGKEAAESNVDQFTERYSRQPYEIAAQYMSLVSMRSCLPSLWQEIENEDGKVVKGSPEYRDQKAAKYTDRMICAYVNHRMRCKSEFVHRPFPFTSVDDILRSFENKFLECADAHRKYGFEEERHGYVRKQVDRHDACDVYGISLEDAKFIEKCEFGSHQDMMICGAFRAECRDSYFDLDDVLDKPALNRPDLSLQAVFSRTPQWQPPEFEPSAMDKMTNMAEEAMAGRSKIAKNDQIFGRGPP